MSDPEKPVLEERVARLERLVEALIHRNRSEQYRSEPGAPSRPQGVKPPAAGGSREPRPEPGRGPGGEPRPQPAFARPIAWTEQIRSLTLAGQSERWLGRIGIGFVVLAIALLLQLGFVRGWITPAFRLVVGLGVDTDSDL